MDFQSGEKRPGTLTRFCLGAVTIVLIVLVCMGVTALMPKPDAQAMDSQSVLGAESAQPEATPTPAPTLTPTPALYAPFGAQYGFGGAELIPQTPTPQPTASPTPAPQSTVQSAVQETALPVTQETVLPVVIGTQPPATLRRGAKGEDVVRLQRALIDLGYLSGEADGDFGTKTQTAVASFQAVNGLEVDGIAGAKTQAALYGGSALSADQAPPADFLILINRENTVDANYVPPDLVDIADVVPGDVVTVKYKGAMANRTACEALEQMLRDAIDEGIGDWQVSSAYRTYQSQQSLVEESVAEYKRKNPSWTRERCLSATYQTVAPAGASEHQSGLAFDVTTPGTTFSGTKQQKWLHQHCYEYGFVVRFTEKKQAITGFLAESWHIRYVGTQPAAVMTFNDWCLEEYTDAMR